MSYIPFELLSFKSVDSKYIRNYNISDFIFIVYILTLFSIVRSFKNHSYLLFPLQSAFLYNKGNYLNQKEKSEHFQQLFCFVLPCGVECLKRHTQWQFLKIFAHNCSTVMDAFSCIIQERKIIACGRLVLTHKNTDLCSLFQFIANSQEITIQ